MSRQWFNIATSTNADCTNVMVYGVIGKGPLDDDGITSDEFVNRFNSIKTPNINLRINSPGGSINDGVAISTAIKEHPANVVAHVDGLAASIASVITCACDEVVMDSAAQMMIHSPLQFALGNSAKLRKIADQLDSYASVIAEIYSAKSGKSVADCKAAMDGETWFNAAEAKSWGLVDSIKNDPNEDPDDPDDDAYDIAMQAGAKFLNQFTNVPEDVRRMFNVAARPTHPRQQEQHMPSKVIHRDGKAFAVVNGAEIELEGVTPPPALNVVTHESLLNVVTEDAAKEREAKAGKAAADKAVADERAYRSMFNAILTTANLAGEAAAKFEKDFYGRAENDLKFLASHAIGTRAQAVGEGSADEGGATNEGAPDPKIIKEVTVRFSKDKYFRQWMKCGSADPNSDEYKRGLNRAIAIEMKSIADEKNGVGSKVARDSESFPEGDKISRLMKNNTVMVGAIA